ncbi:MAG: GNAT family N-acetyltransferase [Burkholderiales bacterium]|nr:GNAT family N-acetyltransferase [Burkholderiales bacterium]
MSVEIANGYRPGCIGRVATLHAEYYSAASGFGVDFEAKVARELAGFCLDYQPGRDDLWLALVDGRIEGSIVIDGAHAADDGAHLRWFIVSDALRGSGAGRALLSAALAFTDARYQRTYLWTFAGLHAARHLYEAHGFRLAQARPGAQWGKVVDEQRFERDRPVPEAGRR